MLLSIRQEIDTIVAVSLERFIAFENFILAVRVPRLTFYTRAFGTSEASNNNNTSIDMADTTQSGRIQLPGFGLPLGQTSGIPNAVVDWAEKPITVR